jgi:hypothetical protein
MANYRVEWQEVSDYYMEVEAEDEDTAWDIAMSMSGPEAIIKYQLFPIETMEI